MIDKKSVVKVYGPYDNEKKQPDSPYVTIYMDKKKAKVINSNTEINLEEISHNFFTSKVYTFQELKIIDEERLIWIDNTRSRSEKKKHDTMELIIHNGTELFTSKEARDFSMRKLARTCGMTVGNLYAYVDSKRDLWYAITQRHFNDLDEIISKIIQNNEHNAVGLLKTVIKKFVKFSRANYPRHKMMFFTLAPPPPKVERESEAPAVGIFEENFEEKKTLNKVVQLINKARENGEISIEDPLQFTYFIFGVVQGNIIEGFEYSQRILNDQMKEGIQKSEDEWKSFRHEIEEKFDRLLLSQIDHCLSMR